MNTKEQLMNIVSICNSMLQTIEKETLPINEIGKKIDFEQLKNVSKKFKFSNDIINHMPEAYKISYIRMMLFIIRDIEDDKKLENALLHIFKVAGAANVNINIQEEFISVHKIDENIFGNMMQDLTRMNEVESQTFIVDVMYMLIASDISDKDIKETVGAIVIKLGLREIQIRELFELINIIVNRDANTYYKLCKRDLSIDLRDFNSYLGEVVSGVMSESKKLCWINKTIPFKRFLEIAREEIREATLFSNEIKKYYFDSEITMLQNLKIGLQEYIYFTGKEVVIENCEITVGKFDFDFFKCKKVVFNKCKIIGISRYMSLNECEEVFFKDTLFEGTDSVKCFKMNKGIQIKVENCSFVDFSTNEKSSSSYGAYYGCFDIQEVSKVHFANTHFQKCRARHWERGNANVAVGCIYGTKNIVFSCCDFIYCKNEVWKYGHTWEDRGYMFEFDKGVRADFKNCTFDNCVECIDPQRK